MPRRRDVEAVPDSAPGSTGGRARRAEGDVAPEVAEFRQKMDEGRRTALAWAVRHPVSTGRIALWVRSLPTVSVAPADDRAGYVLCRRFGGIGLLRTGRHAQAALVLPADLGTYWKGQRRKVFRNKVASSHRSGITARLLRPDEIAGAVQAIFDGRGWTQDMRAETESLLEVPLESAFASASCSPGGEILSVCLAVASGDVAQIRWGLSVARGTARWSAFAALLEGAHHAGVTTLLVGRIVGAVTEDEYFHRKTGFEPSNVAIVGVLGHRRWTRPPAEASDNRR